MNLKKSWKFSPNFQKHKIGQNWINIIFIANSEIYDKNFGNYYCKFKQIWPKIGKKIPKFWDHNFERIRGKTLLQIWKKNWQKIEFFLAKFLKHTVFFFYWLD